MTHRSMVASLLGLIMLMGVAGAPSLAQEPGVERIPITVALVEEVEHSSARAMILREVEGIPKDVILLERRGANVSRLAAALGTFITARRVLGADFETVTRMPIDGRTAGNGFFSRRSRKDMKRLLKYLERTDATDLIGVGSVPNLTIWIPADPVVEFTQEEP